MSTCRSCHAEIWWAVTAGGKRMPVDSEPTPDGNVIVVGTDPGSTTEAVPQVRVLAGPAVSTGTLFDEVDQPRYTSHFATCPNADTHRKRDHA